MPHSIAIVCEAIYNSIKAILVLLLQIVRILLRACSRTSTSYSSTHHIFSQHKLAAKIQEMAVRGKAQKTAGSLILWAVKQRALTCAFSVEPLG